MPQKPSQEDRAPLRVARVPAAPIPPMIGNQGPRRCRASFAQQRLWFLARLLPHAPLYNMPVVRELSGQLDTAALRACINTIVARHAVLRTTFAEDGDGQVVQEIAATRHIPLSLSDLSAERVEMRHARLRELLDAEAQKPFDLARGPLVRVLLVRLESDRHVLLVNMHHIVSDGWSFGVFFGELEELYLASLTRRPPALPPLPLQYADYSEWQAEHLSGPRLEALLTYWRGALAGAPDLLSWPLSRPRPLVQAHRGATKSFHVAARDGAALKALLGTSGKTPFMGLLTVFAILLHKYTQQDDIVIGTPVANRTRFEVENLIGFFVNTLPIRLRIASAKSFLGLLDRVSGVTLGAYDHQDLPFERIVEELRPTRSLSHSPLFQVMFAFQTDRTSPDPVTQALSQESVAVADIRMSKFDLSLHAAPAGDGFLCGFEYDVDLFDPAAIDTLAEQFVTVLRQVTAAPDKPIGSFALGDRERALVSPWQLAGASASPIREGGLARLIELQAGRTPSATAIAWREQQLTYAELDRRTNRLAHVLQAAGVGRETPVAVMVTRSPSLLVLLLAILKASGAYVPLSLRDPQDRVRYAVETSGCEIVICDDARRRAELGDLATVLDLGELERQALAAPEVALPAVVGPDDLAYIIFTSGSTGRPKGVAVAHRGILALVDWAGRHFNADELRAVLASTAITFDISVFEMFAPLCHGGTVVMAESILDLLSAPPSHPISLINTVPSAMAELVAAQAVPSGVRTICLAGEALSLRLAQTAAVDGRRLVNLYGPTEDSVYATGWSYRPETGRSPPIGRPIGGHRAYVLDRDLDPVLQAHVGELFLAGDGIARGYVGQPRLTAASFLPDPFSNEPGARMYRTGDRARVAADGELEFLGRTDHQLKLRGFRIEPSEIETVLQEHAHVEAAVVQLIEADGHGRRLTAWLASPEPRRLNAEKLRDHLRRRLPDYMIPADFVLMDQLPRTRNGKIDRAALPMPQAADAGADRASQQPRNDLERRIAAAWREVLGHGNFGIHQDFFDLGGHSLMVARIASRLSHVLTEAPPLRSYFEFRTIAELAQALDSSGARLIDAPRVAPGPDASMRKPRTAAEAKALLSRIDSYPQDAIDRLLSAFRVEPESST